MEECAEDHIQHYTRIEEPHDILNQLNFSQTPQDPHKEPTKSIPTKDGPNGVKKGVPESLLSPFRPIFHVESPTDSLREVLLGRPPLGVGQTLGSAEPGRLPGQVHFDGRFVLILLKSVPGVSILNSASNCPWRL
jgi:hypothetical protein